MINEERKFISIERVRRKDLYNMITEWQKVLRYIKRYFKVNISESEYLFVIGDYSLLKEKYLK